MTALRTFANTLRQYAIAPRAQGELVYENTAALASRYMGLHGTQLDQIEDQLPEGVFTPRGSEYGGFENVYVYRPFPWNAAQAAMWAKNHPEAIIVEVGSNAPPLKNRLFNTLLFENHPESPLVIHRVWKVTEAWKDHAWHPKS